MIRLLLVAVFLIVYLLVSIPLIFVEWLISLARPDFHKRPVVFRWVTAGFRAIYALAGVRLTVIGKDRIPKDEAVLYIGNHQSYFDIVIAYGLMPSFTGFISKKVMRRIPVFSALMTYMNCLFLDRDDIRQGMETILRAIDLVKEGISICIYPEGTRNRHPDTFLEFHKGSFKIAQRTNCPIVPVTVVGTREIYENHSPLIKSKPVILEYGEPFKFSDLSKEEQKAIHAYTAEKIKETYDRNKAALTA